MADPFDLNQLQEPLNLPFPAATKQVAGMVNGVQTDVMTMNFSDRILITISQKGRLAHWLHVPLANENPGTEGSHIVSDATDDSLLPISNLTATSLLGGRVPGHETVGQLYARQIASAIVMKTPGEKRLLVVGLGLETADADRDVFFSIIDLVLQCI
ncbi:hypothetical protein ASPWEDRAFT_24373 [Aspergillus wentii DTO 134E9]|uniref:Proteasome assembly chaperone 3 n=1 Tax=Aspergillus wentii DTO 134E9 TaxID=1073089 RepID=A0A1L9RU14_ASPWE|nr:uncharacterized protein ASPWEDRAFT_24373 [Aspergillus wentii DTO 134E9]OJJ38441.1 hypothetical protein ASPWEDRAFT_24373 [Aspergillus wentii DTO 134E9]